MMLGRKPSFAVLFDMDGTIIDSEPYWMASEQALAAEHNGTWTTTDSLGVIGKDLNESSKLFKDATNVPLEVEEIKNRLSNDVQSRLAKVVPWRAGAQELLQDLRKHKVKTALVTMSLHTMAQQVVDAIPFDAFDVIVAGDDVTRGKPHPEAYQKAAALLGFDPSQCIAFEDSVTGLTSAEAAGTYAIGIPNIIPIPEKEGRILWPTLEGVTYKQLKKLIR
jgi:HAD superfamily hydrolase (TIGR01509 family)